MTPNFAEIISSELNISNRSVIATIKLLDDGATIPFISRYRKEITGGLDEVAIHNIQLRYEGLKDLAHRKEYILETIEQQGKLSSELRNKIETTFDSVLLEDIYMPFKPKRRTRAETARNLGLEPLAKVIMSQSSISAVEHQAQRSLSNEIKNTDDAISGALDIIAEWVSESEKARHVIRTRYTRSAQISSSIINGKENEGANYLNYHNFSQPLRHCSSHRYLAMRRGEEEGFLKVSITIDDNDAIEQLNNIFVKRNSDNNIAQLVKQAVKDGYKRLLRPSIETEIASTAKIKADTDAINLFVDNVRQLLFAPPLGSKRILGIDPGFRTGCKVVCLDNQGNLMHNDVIYPCAPTNDFKGAARKISYLVEAYKIDAIALGNGTASRETERFLSSIHYPRNVQVYVVNENGASIYSASKVAREEFPDKDVTVRGAVSIGRRLLDPLAELVKIEPKSIGVGQYQHDVDQTRLKEALDFTVTSCVNSVGVNLNSASKELLSYVSGIGPQLAENIVKYRAENGDFESRKTLLNVPRMGEKTFKQCAGFLRIPGAINILDNTAVHPESYDLVSTIATDNNCTISQLVENKQLLHSIDLNKYVTDIVGLPTLNDIITELDKPGRDPRTSVSIMQFDETVKTIEDLRIGMKLNGIVNNITAFGVFVDIGIKESGLVHISQLSDKYISSPAEVVSLHQHVKVKVIDIDTTRRRISLSMKDINPND
ncbi:MAG: RNA-binding transcriptional accessory protein [Muribaculaceae bacterium]|nr:RNA-binding transcriptional accessory protein [Muribaculaceae bacterium]